MLRTVCCVTCGDHISSHTCLTDHHTTHVVTNFVDTFVVTDCNSHVWSPNVVTKFFETFVVTDQHTGHVVTKCSDQICGDQFFETFADWSPHWPNVVTKFCETFVLTDHHNSHVWWPNLLKHLLTDHHTGVSPGPFQRLSFSHPSSTSSYSSFSHCSSYKRRVFLVIFRRDTTF